MRSARPGRRRLWLAAAAIIVACGPYAVPVAVAGETPVRPGTERVEMTMGTLARVALFSPADTRAEREADPGKNAAVLEAAFAAFREVDAAMSLHRPTSELVRVNAHAAEHAEPVSPLLFEVLQRARVLSALTDGAFDVTILPLLRAWGAHAALGPPTARPALTVGYAGLQLDARAHTVRFQRRGMGVDLGAIAKGFALDRAHAALTALGVAGVRLDLGGELAFVGASPDGTWRVAVRDPTAPASSLGVLSLGQDAAVSTSGNYARDFVAEGWRTASHLYDPRTLRPVPGTRAVTVWAPDSTTADALSTALLVLGEAGASTVLARFPDVGALFVEGEGAARIVHLHGRPPLAWRLSGSTS